LRITGCRHDGERARGCRFLVMEIGFGCFESVVDVPAEFDLAHASAAFENGLLTIEVPRRTKARKSPRGGKVPQRKRTGR
jgi:HSP20 family molecular chaperone IbpA